MPTRSKSSTTISAGVRAAGAAIPVSEWIPPETCGEILLADFLEPAGITPYRLAKEINVPQTYISKILHGGGVSAEMGAKLDRYFGMSNGWWSGLQSDYENRIARRKIAEQLGRIQPVNSKEE